jgi:hypothetical protein
MGGAALLGSVQASGGGDPALVGSGFWVTGVDTNGHRDDIDKMPWATETSALLSTVLSRAYNYAAGASDPGVAGYHMGGGASLHDTIEKFNFTNDTIATLGITLTEDIYANAGFADPAVAGYSAGGSPSVGWADHVDRINFTNDAKSTLTNGLANGTGYVTGNANPAVAGYSSGGYRGTWPVMYKDIDRWAFSSETHSMVSAGLSLYTMYHAGIADAGVAFYFGGGQGDQQPGWVASMGHVDRWACPSEVRSAVSTDLSVSRSRLAGASNSGTAGYFGAGYTGSHLDTVDRYVFPAETRTVLGNALTEDRYTVTSWSDCGALA